MNKHGMAEQMDAKGFYTVEHRNSTGELLWSGEFPNLVTTLARNHTLDNELAELVSVAVTYSGIFIGIGQPYPPVLGA